MKEAWSGHTSWCNQMIRFRAGWNVDTPKAAATKESESIKEVGQPVREMASSPCDSVWLFKRLFKEKNPRLSRLKQRQPPGRSWMHDAGHWMARCNSSAFRLASQFQFLPGVRPCTPPPSFPFSPLLKTPSSFQHLVTITQLFFSSLSFLID